MRNLQLTFWSLKMMNPVMHKSINVTQVDVDTYKKDGVVCLRGLLSEEDLSLLRSGYKSQYQNRHNSLSSYDFEEMRRQAFAGEREDFDMGASERFDMELLKLILATDDEARPIKDEMVGEDLDEGEFFHDAAGWRFYPEIKAVALNSKLPAAVSRLMDANETRFWEDTTFAKAPRTPQRTVFHQDWSYFQIDGDQCCIVWIPLDAVDAENGRMEYIRGSHLSDKIYAPNVLFAQSASPISPYDKLPDIEANREDYDIISFDVQPGDVIIHHVMTLHGSAGNISSDRNRRAFSFRYCGEKIKYFDKPGAIEQQYQEKRLKNGEPLSGPDYPIVWSHHMHALLQDCPSGEEEFRMQG